MRGGAVEIVERLEERSDRHGRARQSHEELHFEQVRHFRRHAHDVNPERFRPEFSRGQRGEAQRLQDVPRRRRKFHQRHQGQGTRRRDGAREQAALLRLAQFRIIGPSADLGDRGRVRGGVLPQIEPRHVQSESVDALDRRPQFPLGQHRAAAGLETLADHLQHLADRADPEKSGAFDRFAGEAFLIADFGETARHLSAQDSEEEPIGLMRIALAHAAAPPSRNSGSLSRTGALPA